MLNRLVPSSCAVCYVILLVTVEQIYSSCVNGYVLWRCCRV